jgi:hypothetical protein
VTRSSDAFEWRFWVTLSSDAFEWRIRVTLFEWRFSSDAFEWRIRVTLFEWRFSSDAFEWRFSSDAFRVTLSSLLQHWRCMYVAVNSEVVGLVPLLWKDLMGTKVCKPNVFPRSRELKLRQCKWLLWGQTWTNSSKDLSSNVRNRGTPGLHGVWSVTKNQC